MQCGSSCRYRIAAATTRQQSLIVDQEAMETAIRCQRGSNRRQQRRSCKVAPDSSEGRDGRASIYIHCRIRIHSKPPAAFYLLPAYCRSLSDRDRDRSLDG